jgi:HlyD family secretion protein
LVLVLLLAAGAVVGGRALKMRQAAATDASAGEVVTVSAGDLAAVASSSGRLLAQRSATLALPLAGRVEAVYVRVGDLVREGDLLVQTESGALQRAYRTAEQNLVIQQSTLAEMQTGAAPEEIAAAQAAVDSAQAQVDQLLAGPRPMEVAAAAASLRAAEASLTASARQRDQLVTAVGDSELAAAQAQLIQAELAWRQARDAHDATMRCFEGPTGEEVCPGLGRAEEQARYGLAIAEKNLEAAQAQLERLQAGPDANQLAAANANVAAVSAQRDGAQAQVDLLLAGATGSQIAAARAQLAQAQASLAALREGVSAERLAITQAQVELARIGLEDALDNLTKTSLVAPFDGMVTAVYVSPGELASGPAVELVDTDSLEVVLNVDEVDIGQIAVGQEAVVTLETWPDQPVTGVVISIAPKAQTALEIVTYEVHLSLQPHDLPVLTGMTANAELVTANRIGVLLVPNRAIIADRQAGKYYVDRLAADGAVERVQVVIGLRDSRYTEILNGIQEGERVVVGGDQGQSLLDFGQGSPTGFRELRR